MAEMIASITEELTSRKLNKILEAQRNVLENIDDLMAEGVLENESELLGEAKIDETNQIGKLYSHSNNQFLNFSHCVHKIWICDM
jgi:hypothetical protein